MSLTPDERLVSTDSGGTVSVWDPRRDRGTQARSVSPWDRWIAVGPKGPIVSNGWDDLYVFDFDGTCRHALPKERGGYVTMCPVRNGRVAVASREWGLRVLDAWRGAWEFGLDASPDSVTGMAALTDGRLVTTGRDKMLRVWNLDSGACEEVIEAQIALHDLAVVADRYAVSSGPQHSEIFDLEARHSVYRLPTVYCNYVPLGDGLVALKHSGKDCTDIVHLPSGEIRTRLAGEWPQMATPESGLLTWRPRRGLTWFGVDGESRGRIADVLGSPLAVSPESLVATKEENRICVRRLGSDALVAAWDTRPLDARLLLFLGRRLFVARETGPLLVLDVELDT